MSAAINTLARTTVLDAVADTAGDDRGRESLAEKVALATPACSAKDSQSLSRRRWRLPVGMADNAPPPIEPQVVPATWERRVRRSAPPVISFFASVVVHLILLLVAALVAVGIQPPIGNGIVVESVTTPIDQEELVTLAAPLDEAIIAREDASHAAFTAVEVDPGLVQEGVPAVVLLEIADGEVSNLLGDIAGLAEGAGDGLSSAGNGPGADGEEDKAGQGTDFFGVQAAGRKFVFVCDCSGSMSGLKWQELNRELSRCIGSLVPGQAFYAIFFDGEMHPMFEPFGREPALLDATTENIEKAREWIASKSLGSNTSPCDSMKFAASLEPDAIFLLTDGEFSDYTAPYMRDFNKKRAAKGKPKVVVHTIGFFSQKHQMVLERIAKDSGGTYQFVAGPKPVREKRKSQNVIARPIGLPALGGPVPQASGE